MHKQEIDLNEKPKKMSLVTKIFGVAVLAAALFTTCGCDSYSSQKQISKSNYSFGQYNYPEYTRRTLINLVFPKNNIYSELK